MGSHLTCHQVWAPDGWNKRQIHSVQSRPHLRIVSTAEIGKPLHQPTVMSFVKVNPLPVVAWAIVASVGPTALAQLPSDFGVATGKLLYRSPLDSKQSAEGWVMEGPGTVEFADGWMTGSR
jgi:hypothetical protein